jgi:isopenicillin N synthase-like dioxygenase
MDIDIPIISLSDYYSKKIEDKKRFIKSVGNGLANLGFISIVDHNIPELLISQAYKSAEKFFNLPEQSKQRYEKTELAGQRGYTSFQRERAKNAGIGDLKEFWHIGPPEDSTTLPNIWPLEILDFQLNFQSLYCALTDCALALLEACALYLGEPEDLFTKMTLGGNSILRVIHYPPVPQYTDGAVRAAAHEDINFITLLCGATQPGLQILSRSNEWLSVPSIPGQIIVDTGDMLQNLTNGIFKSTTHRVINPEGENISRYSIPFFVHPSSNVSLAPLKSCVNLNGSKPEYRSFTAGEYLNERLREIGLMTKSPQAEYL